MNGGPSHDSWGRVRAWVVTVAVGAAAISAWSPSATLAQGLALEPEGRYQSFPVLPRFRAFLPPQVDLSDKFPAPGYQGPQGSCTAWAVGYSLRGYYLRRAGLSTDVSPSFIYNQINPNRGQCTTPTYLSAALDLVKKVGAVPLQSFPYDPDHCSALPDQRLLAAAGALRIEGYERVDVTDLDNLKGELAHGHPVVFGMEVSKDLENLKPGEIYDGKKPPDFGHAMVAVGYDEARQAIKVINSWGKGWADGGYGWISYGAFKTSQINAFIMRVRDAAPPAVVANVPPPESQPTRPTPAADVEIVPRPPPAPVPPPSPPAPSVTVTTVVQLPLRPARPQPAPIKASDMERQIKQSAAGLSCTRLDGRLLAGDRVELTGFIDSDGDKTALRERLSEFVPADHIIDASLQVRPWPQCEALLTFTAPFARPAGLMARLVSPASVLRDGEQLAIAITTPKFPAYIYVTYLQAGGDAVHLLQPHGLVPRPLPPASKLRIGGPTGPLFRITPPFGREMIIVLASASPLFDSERPQSEVERDYLTAFRRALTYRPPGAPNVNRTVAGAAIWLETAANK